MTSPVTGEPTNALFAFTGMLMKLFEQFGPNYVIMAIDSPGKTFRDELYEDYKAHREPPPDELVAQFDRVFEITRLFGIPLLGRPGAEADDVIATVTRRVLDDPAHDQVKIRIVSKDKDLEQLLGDRVTLFDIHTDTLIDTDWLKAHKGINPDQVVDVLTLTGDKVDNIPGVEGVGPKTAAKLLQQYGSVQGIYDHLDQIKGKRHENLIRARDFIPLAQKLVTLKQDMDIDFSLEDACVGPIDAAKLKRLFKELGFRRHQSDLDRLLARSTHADSPPSDDLESSTTQSPFAHTLFDTAPPLGSISSGKTPLISVLGGKGTSGGLRVGVEQSAHDAGLTTATDYKYTAVTSLTELDDLTQTLKRQQMIAVDTETVGLGHRAKLCGLCFAWETGRGVYVPVLSPDPSQHLDTDTVLAALGPLLEDTELPKCGHNIKYDMLVLRHAGVHLRGVAFDSMIASFLIGLPGHGMDALALAQLKHETIPISQLIGQRGRGMPQKTMDQVPLDQITPYAAEDADITLRLYEHLSPMLSQMSMQALAQDVEMPLVDVLAEMEYRGIKVDPDVLVKQKAQLSTRIEDLRERISAVLGPEVNPDSPKQLGDALFNKMGLPVVKRTKTGFSTDNEVLEKLCDREDLTPDQAAAPKLLIEYRQLTKLVNTYLDNLRSSIHPTSGRVHASFHQTGAATGRLSSSNPNLQNIPIRTDIGRQIRKAFLADPGPPAHCLISADYSQIELRILAHLSEDSALIDAFQKDLDIHTAVAAQVFDRDPADITPAQRDRAKTINFGIIYGITAFGLARRVDSLNVAAAKQLIADYRQRFAGIDTFLAQCIQQATEEGYVTTMLGRRRPIRQIQATHANTRKLGERLAINTVVQGSAADLIKLAMVNLHRRIQHEHLPMKLLIQIHDELVFETPVDASHAAADIVRHEMEQAIQLKVPLKVDVGVGPDWFSAK